MGHATHRGGWAAAIYRGGSWRVGVAYLINSRNTTHDETAGQSFPLYCLLLSMPLSYHIYMRYAPFRVLRRSPAVLKQQPHRAARSSSKTSRKNYTALFIRRNLRVPRCKTVRISARQCSIWSASSPPLERDGLFRPHHEAAPQRPHRSKNAYMSASAGSNVQL